MSDSPTALHMTSRKLASALEEVNCGIAARDPAGRIVYANRRLHEWLGYDSDELLGRHVSALFPPELSDLLKEEMKAAEEGDSRARLTMLVRKDRTTFPVITLPHRIEDEAGAYRGSLAVIVDLGSVQTAKPVGYSVGAEDARSTLSRIALELQSMSVAASLPAGAALPLHHDALRDLSPRESEVLAELVSGSRVPSIARKLHISQHTVRNHLKSIYRKAGVQSQAELIEWVRSLA